MPRPLCYPVRPSHPVIGGLQPHWAGVALGTDFEEFVTPTMQGLARILPGQRLEILAIAAKVPGGGDCGRFLAECQQAYDAVCVWDVLNPHLAGMLERRGYAKITRYEDREILFGYEWHR